MPNLPINVRTLSNSDKKSIKTLLEKAVTTHTHPDWYLLVDWLGTPGFAGIFTQNYLDSFLAVGADNLPTFWVRGCAFSYRTSRKEHLVQLLETIKPWLAQQKASILGWITTNSWLNQILPQLGFKQLATITTMSKKGWELPLFPTNSQIQIRSLQATDYSILEQIERETFNSLWGYSYQTIVLAAQQATHFDVALLRGQVVGYQCTTYDGDSAHLARIVVHPKTRRMGIGSALLQTVIDKCRHNKVEHISLNTQINNEYSQYLYRKFGFEFINHQIPIWGLFIDDYHLLSR